MGRNWSLDDHGGWVAALPETAPVGETVGAATLALKPFASFSPPAQEQLLAGELPSGLPGLHVEADDHIALVVFDDGDAYYAIILDFIAAGIEDPIVPERLSLELSEGRSPLDAALELEKRIGSPPPTRLDIRGWERNRSDYEPEFFDRPGMLRAMDSEYPRVQPAAGALLRVASEDCSNFMKWLSNPADYLRYEYQLGRDLRARLHGHSFVQLCAFKTANFAAMADKLQQSPRDAVLDVALSHNKVLVLADGRTLFSAKALRFLLGRAWPPRSFSSLVKIIRVALRVSAIEVRTFLSV